MEISSQKADQILIFGFTGRLDAQSAPEAESQVKGWLAEGEKKLVGDLTGLDYISSAGLRVLLMTAKNLSASGGKLCLFGLQPPVQEVFDLAGFSAVIPLAVDRQAALDQVAG